MLRIGHEVSFGPGDVIFEAGDRADGMFVVLEGEAQVDVGSRFHRLRVGDGFGEMARAPWSPTAVTTSAER
jgi:CRP-like cAMP-binding protein